MELLHNGGIGQVRAQGSPEAVGYGAGVLQVLQEDVTQGIYDASQVEQNM